MSYSYTFPNMGKNVGRWKGMCRLCCKKPAMRNLAKYDEKKGHAVAKLVCQGCYILNRKEW